MTWKVDPAGVQSVLTGVQSDAQPVFAALGKIDGEVQGASTGAQSQMIVSALGEFFSAMTSNVETIQKRVPAAIDGAATATMAIVHGDEQMAADTERAAASSGAGDNLSPMTGSPR